MKLEIYKIGQDGDGIAYDNKKPVFVKNALIGEEVDVRITHDFGNYKTAVINRILKESSMRNHVLCPCNGKCGGCNIAHAKYEQQLDIKVNLLKQSLLKYAGLDWDIEIEPSNCYGYRNSIKVPFAQANGKLVTSMYHEETNHFVIFDDCYNHEEILETTRKEILKLANRYNLTAYDRHSKKGLRYLYMRHLNNGIQICLVTGEDNLDKDFVYKVSKLDNVVSLYQSINTSKTTHSIFGRKMINLAGANKLRFKVNGIKATLSMRSFYQMNTSQASRMYDYVVSLMDDNQDLIVEAYCGIGIMSLLSSKKTKEIIGIEIIDDAIVNAQNNAQLNNITNAKFICGDSGEELKKISKRRKIDTLLVDPPRGGLDDLMLETIIKSKIKYIIYVSCNDVTLAQNIETLKRFYQVESIKAFDMFPNTTHVESVVKLKKK